MISIFLCSPTCAVQSLTVVFLVKREPTLEIQKWVDPENPDSIPSSAVAQTARLESSRILTAKFHFSGRTALYTSSTSKIRQNPIKQIQTKNPRKQANSRLSLSIIVICCFFFLNRFMDKKIGRFFDSVGSFFSGADVIPWCDRDIIAVRSLSSFLSHVIPSSLRN